MKDFLVNVGAAVIAALLIYGLVFERAVLTGALLLFGFVVLFFIARAVLIEITNCGEKP